MGNEAVNAGKYRPQFETFHKISRKKLLLINRKSVLLLHDNPRQHIARVVKENIITLNIDVLPHPVTLLILLHLSSFSGHWNIILEGKRFIYCEDDKTDIVPLHRNLNNFYA